MEVLVRRLYSQEKQRLGRKYPNDVDYIYNYLLRHVDKGEVIILHDTLKCAVEGFLKALPVLIERGYTFVTVDELVQLSPGAVYPASWR